MAELQVECAEHGLMELNEVPVQLQGTLARTWQCRAGECRAWLTDEDAHRIADRAGVSMIKVGASPA